MINRITSIRRGAAPDYFTDKERKETDESIGSVNRWWKYIWFIQLKRKKYLPGTFFVIRWWRRWWLGGLVRRGVRRRRRRWTAWTGRRCLWKDGIGEEIGTDRRVVDDVELASDADRLGRIRSLFPVLRVADCRIFRQDLLVQIERTVREQVLRPDVVLSARCFVARPFSSSGYLNKFSTSTSAFIFARFLIWNTLSKLDF